MRAVKKAGQGRAGLGVSRLRRRPAPARARPDYKSPLNKAVFPTWGRVPQYVPPLNRYMRAAVRGTIIAIGDVVDHRGDFELPRAQHADAIGVSARVAYGALETLRDAGLIKVKHQGSRNQATVWSYVPVAGFDSVKARKVFQAASRRAAERIVAATQP
jgi:hypothetical protein